MFLHNITNKCLHFSIVTLINLSQRHTEIQDMAAPTILGHVYYIMAVSFCSIFQCE